jgi:glycolate oxidase FAD binding subunit
MEEITKQLCSIVGSDHVSIDKNHGVVVFPSDPEEVKEIVKFAGHNHLTLTPRGNGTKNSWGMGDLSDIHLSLVRLNRIIEHPWQDLTCTVQAGCTWAKLQGKLAVHGQFIALDPLFKESATVGGILATNDSGVLRQRYGSLRDLVIGMTVVLADGTKARTGGKVVKNVAGYDLCKLMTGSLGTLAVITEASFRLHPLPQYTQNFTIAAPKASRLASLFMAIRASHLLTQALQLRYTRSVFHLDVQLNSHPEAHQERILAQMVMDEGLSLEEVSSEVWDARETLFSSDATVLRISTLPTQVCEYAEQLQSMHLGAQVMSITQAFGLHYVTIRGESDIVASTIRKIRADAATAQATVAILQVSDGVKASAFEIPTTTLLLMRAVKQQFDPGNIFNPGKFFA